MPCIRALLAALAVLAGSQVWTPASAQSSPENFIYSGDGLTPDVRALLKRPEIGGVQLIYSWRQLEPEEGRYDFSAIERDLSVVNGEGKELFVQIQDRFFQTRHRNIPEYLLTEPLYHGGLAPQIDNPGEDQPQQQGWVTVQWNPSVRARFQALLAALADEFDGRIHGLNLPESSADIDRQADQTGFTCDGYVDATLENINAARAAFQNSHVIQYVNFWPCEWNDDQGYMTRIFEDAAARGYGLGGPDIVPYRRGQMKNSYPFFNSYRDRLPLIAMAVQEPTLTYTNPETGKRFTSAEIRQFATDYLGVDIIFWTAETDWLKALAE